jgi:hypothetical protein
MFNITETIEINKSFLEHIYKSVLVIEGCKDKERDRHMLFLLESSLYAITDLVTDRWSLKNQDLNDFDREEVKAIVKFANSMLKKVLKIRKEMILEDSHRRVLKSCL